MCSRKDEIRKRVERLIKAVRAVEEVRPQHRNEKKLHLSREWQEQKAAATSLEAFLDVAENQIEAFL